MFGAAEPRSAFDSQERLVVSALGGARLRLAVIRSGAIDSLRLSAERQEMLGQPRLAALESGLDGVSPHQVFQRAHGVRSMNEIYLLENVAEAYARMENGKARFRVVLTTEN